ncbi:MAG: type III pantothenate kinase [Chthoniobacterales bacterium]
MKSSSLPTERWLLIDASNSTSKFALSTPQRLLSIRRAPTVSLTTTLLAEIVAEWPVERVIVASVVPKATRLLTSFFKKKKIPFLSIDTTLNLGIRLRYPNPASIGADRLANVIATTHLYGSPAIVVDFGTAITFDIIDIQGAYLGGVIAPGLKTGADALHQRAALLPQTLPAPIRRAVGKSTLAAIHSGLLLGARGLVREVVERVTKENFSGQKPMIIATGTDAKLVARGMKLVDHVNPQLTLEGLREAGNLQPVPCSL